MKNRTRNLTLSAVLVALNVVFLYLAVIFPTGRMGFVAVSSLFVVAGVIEMGLGPAILVFIGCSILSALILPDKTAVIVYVLFFGYYPVVKSLAERMRSKVLSWAIKLAVFNAAFTCMWFLFKSLLFDSKYLELNLLLIYPAVNLIFVVFDIGLSRLISFYIVRISRILRKNKQ